MARGHRDWGIASPEIPAVQVIGQFPKYGNVVLSDDLEGVLSWEANSTDDTATVSSDTTTLYHGAQSLKLIVGTTTPAADVSGWADRKIPAPGSKLVEVEFRFYPDIATKFKFVGVGLAYYDLTNSHVVFIGINDVDDKVWTGNAIGDLTTEISEAEGAIKDQAWHRFRVVLDFVSDEIRELEIDDILAEGLSTSITTETDATARYMFLKLFATCRTNQAVTTYFDDVVVRQL